jgi:hypothetical protein
MAAERFRPWLVPALLFGAALLVRLPYLGTIPAPTDETDELLVALSILREGTHPLTTSEPYLSGVWVHLIAAVFALFGTGFVQGRIMNLLLGSLVAPATWAFGRIVAGPLAGLVAGGATVLGFGLVVMGSHVAWSHGTGATFVAVAATCLALARSDRKSGRLAFLGGLAAGLAVGMHPTVLTVLVGTALGWLLTCGLRGSRLARDTALGIAGFVLGYLPILLSVALNGLAPLRERLVVHDYVGTDATSWPLGVALWCNSLARNLVGPAVSSWTDPRVWLMLGLLAIATVFAVRARSWLPVLMVASTALLTPLLVDGEKFTSLTGLRSSAPAVPAAAVLLGIAFTKLWTRAGWRVPLAVAAGCLLLLQGAVLVQFYRATELAGVSGKPLLEVAAGLRAGVASGHTVLLDDDVDTKLVGGGEVGRAMGVLLTLDGTEHTVAKVDKMRWFLLNGAGQTYDLVLSGDTADTLAGEFALEVQREVPVVPGQVSRTGEKWGWYRYRSVDGSAAP